MKTSGMIKKGLECCYSPAEPMMRCEDCPFHASVVCKMRLHNDALAYIQQLEAKCHQLERERDAAVAELELVDCPCDFCRHLKKNASDDPCNGCKYVLRGEESRFEWRGVKEE